MGGLWSKDEPRSKAEPPQGIIYSNFISILDEDLKKTICHEILTENQTIVTFG